MAWNTSNLLLARSDGLAPEMDAGIARRVFGCDEAKFTDKTWWCDCDIAETHYEQFCYTHPKFSTDIAASWLVVEKMHQMDYGVTVHRASLASSIWEACFYHGSWSFRWRDPQSAETAPLAICRAALDVLQTQQT